MNKAQQEVIDTLIKEFEDKESIVQMRGGFSADSHEAARYAGLAIVILAVNYNLHLGKIWRKMGDGISKLAKLHAIRKQIDSVEKDIK